MTLLNTYVLFFFHDVLGIGNASFNTGLVAGAAMVGAVASSVAAGVLSDKLDRRLVVCLSGLPMTLAALGFALFPDPHVIFVFAAMFGLGYGGVFSVGWALALDAVPELGDVARDLGLWGTLSNLPMVIAPALGAFIIARGTTPAAGYRWLFASAGACFLLGSLTVLAVRNANGKKRRLNSNPLLVFAATRRAARVFAAQDSHSPVGRAARAARADGADHQPPARRRRRDRLRAHLSETSAHPDDRRQLAAHVRDRFLRSALAVDGAVHAHHQPLATVAAVRHPADRKPLALARADQPGGRSSRPSTAIVPLETILPNDVLAAARSERLPVERSVDAGLLRARAGHR